MTPPEILDQVAANLQANPACAMATLCTPIDNNKDWQNPNIVKVVRDHLQQAVYFSRAPIPFCREKSEQSLLQQQQFRHIGIYAYRVALLQAFSRWQPSPLEQIERLEQLRILYYGQKIHVDIAQALPGHGVDTEEDLQRLRESMQ